jgi:hypothetical protein
MRRFWKLSTLFIVLLLSTTACSVYHWSGSSSHTCTSGFTVSVQCTVTFTSFEHFNWTASSTVDGVTFQPSSGSDAAGVSSGDIHVTLPYGACPGFLNFTDNTHQILLQFNIARATPSSSHCNITQ